jgi:ABC-type antimicrobial peptide transport system permease subunit
LFRAPSPYLSHLDSLNARAGWAVILGAVAAALVVAVLASAATTWMISRIRPAEVLRSE